MEKRNKLEDGPAYSQAETALCIWEHILDAIPRGRRTDEVPLYRWISAGEGAYNGRMNSINLAYLVDYAYEQANGEECRLDGHAFDWDLVPFMINTWSERLAHPDDVDIDEADMMARLLLVTFGGEVA